MHVSQHMIDNTCTHTYTADLYVHVHNIIYSLSTTNYNGTVLTCADVCGIVCVRTKLYVEYVCVYCVCVVRMCVIIPLPRTSQVPWLTLSINLPSKQRAIYTDWGLYKHVAYM